MKRENNIIIMPSIWFQNITTQFLWPVVYWSMSALTL